MSEHKPAQHEKAYEYLLEKLNENIEEMRELEEDTETSLAVKMNYLLDRVHHFEDLSREELAHVGDYLRRDVEQAAHFLSRSGRSVADWLRDDLRLAGTKLGELFAAAVDKTRMELDAIHEQAEEGDWYTGDITGPGYLHCKKCHHTLHIETTTHVPPCPRCLGTVFSKSYEDADDTNPD